MHANELVNILQSAHTDMKRHRERLERLLNPRQRGAADIDVDDAEGLMRLFNDLVRELDEAITQRSLK